MSDAFRYKGHVLGWIHSYLGDSATKFNIQMNSISALEQLCRLSDGELLEIDGLPPMVYEQFKKQIISKTKRIYLSTHEYNIDFHPPSNMS